MAELWTRARSLLFGVALGRASSIAVEPELEPVRQDAWKANKVRVLGIDRLGQLIAKGITPADAVEDEAGRSGYDRNHLDAAAALSQSYPGSGELNELSNRALITDAQVRKALSRHGIPAEYHDAIMASFVDILTPGELAAAIHRGLVRDPGLLQGEQPEPPFKVDAYPVYPIDALEEAAGSGYDRDRLGVLVGLQGLPMGTHEAAQAFFRGIITHGDYIRAFNESNSRNEWAQAVLEYTRQIPTSRDFFENALRGYHDLEWAIDQAKRHGMSADDALVIYQNQGRPMNVRNITQALARGGKFKPEAGEITDPYLAAIVEGNLKPAYYDLEYARRYTYPSVFAIRSLAQSGGWSFERVEDRLLGLGWRPDDAADVARYWTTTKSSTAKEATASDILTLYDGAKLDATQTLAALAALGYPPDEAAAKVDVIDARRVASAKTTTVSDLHAAFKKRGLTNDATATALAALGIGSDSAARIVAAWDAYRVAENASVLEPATVDPALVQQAQAAGYTVTPPPAPPPDYVLALREAGYVVTPPPVA